MPPPVAAAAGPGIGTLISRAVGAATGTLPGMRRRRRRGGLTMREMEKVAMLAAITGKNSNAVTMAVMRAMGGRI